MTTECVMSNIINTIIILNEKIKVNNITIDEVNYFVFLQIYNA